MTTNLKTVVEISECFPNKFKPVTGEFILQHVKALSRHCNVIAIVPLRLIPPKELLSLNPFKLFTNLKKWFSFLNATNNFSEGNLKVIYFRYFSLPRPFFESIEDQTVSFFYYSKIKNLINNKNPDVIYCNWLRPWAGLSKKLADNFNIPLVIDHHEDIPTLKNLFPDNYKIFLKSLGNADRIIVHSTVNKEELLNESIDLNNEVTINYLGQNFSVDDSVKHFNKCKAKLVCVSHLYERRKNIDVLIKAISLMKNQFDFELKIIGEGSLKKDYIDLTNELNLQDKIFFTGAKSQTQINAVLDESDLFILPSYPEAFGIVFIEALAKGLPVITAEGNGGGEELRKLGYDVVLVKHNSSAELSKAVEELFNDKSRMSEMSSKGKKIVKKYFTWEKNGLRTYDILNDALNNFRKNKCAE